MRHSRRIRTTQWLLSQKTPSPPWRRKQAPIAADLSDVEGLCATVTTALRGLEILKPVVGENDVRTVDVAAAEKLIEKEEGGPLRARHAEVLKSKSDLWALAGADAEAAERATTLRLASERDTAMAKVGSPLVKSFIAQSCG